MKRNHQQGFSLLELMVTLLVMGIVLGFGVPNFMEFQRSSVMTSEANDFVSAIYLARGEAVKRQTMVTLCASANPAAAAPVCGVGPPTGYIVFVDDANPVVPAATDGNAVVDVGEQILLQHPAPAGTIAISTAPANSIYITYAPNGFVVPTAFAAPTPSLNTVLFCDDRGNRDAGGTSTARVVNVAPTGSAQIMRAIADVNVAIAATGGVCP
jgi:prepilin-type N-terminal cleavage/methylation domain-containing protein